jgi:hypothetical protein
VLLAAERSDEQAAALAASLWSGRAPGTYYSGHENSPFKKDDQAGTVLKIFNETAALFMTNKV